METDTATSAVSLKHLLFSLDTTFKLLFCFCQMSSLEAGSEAVVAGKLRNNLWGSFSPRISASVQVKAKKTARKFAVKKVRKDSNVQCATIPPNQPPSLCNPFKDKADSLFLLLTGCKAKITPRNNPDISVSCLLKENGQMCGS
jgi:hypothetical protein